MNEHEAERIAAAAHQLRPDWPTSSVLTLIRRSLMDRPRRDVAVAIAWIACEAGTATPARVLESGPWWKAAGVDGQTTGMREPYDRERFCDVCGKPHGRLPEGDHAFISVIEQTRRLAADPELEQRRAEAAEVARKAALEAKAEGITPPPERARKVNEHVEELRAMVPIPEPVAPPEMGEGEVAGEVGM